MKGTFEPQVTQQQAGSWAAKITSKAADDKRDQPWKKTFEGKTAQADADNDWVPYPWPHNLAKSGMAG